MKILKILLKNVQGNSHLTIFSWLEHFNSQCEIYQLTDFEKLIFAKRLMHDTAKQFVEYESKATNFQQLEQELVEEYGGKVNSAVIHQKLQERKMEKDETSMKYLYEMLAIASQSEIGNAAIYQLMV